ncbi:BREX-1 system adenine-specific DNA-methyltransferase PglX [Brachyspira hyodysenteriae]|nr:BREX-1 system adenine-specific DNA-methyltransferase PglX [Brachyspira hyodysenteriae]
MNLLKIRNERFNNSISNRKEIGNEWYELRGCSFYDRFSEDYILWTDIISIPSFSINLHDELYVDTSAYFLYSIDNNINLKYLLGILNSKVTFYQLKYIAQSLGNAALRIKKYL